MATHPGTVIINSEVEFSITADLLGLFLVYDMNLVNFCFFIRA